MRLSLIGLLSVAALSSPAANIYWVSDNGTEGTGTLGSFAPAGSGFSDDGFVNLLQGAGHSVTRYNPPNSGPLDPADIGMLNSGDLVILGRSIGSGAFQATSGASSWNNDVTAPVLALNAYLTRGSRLGWFVGSTQEDAGAHRLTAVDVSNPLTQFIFADTGFALGTTTMKDDYSVRIDRGTSVLSDAPVAGGVTLATAVVAPTDGSPASFTAIQLAVFPEGTKVRGDADTLAGFRMYLAAGSREPDGGSVAQAGVMDLTPEGQAIFLNAVTLAANNGVVPEPSVAALLGLGVASLLLLQPKRR